MNELVMMAMAAVWASMLARIAFDAVREYRRKAGSTDAVQGHAGTALSGPGKDGFPTVSSSLTIRKNKLLP
jgi:hypothetical protein